MPFLKTIMIPGVLAYSLSFFFIKFTFYGLYYWVPTYLEEELGYSRDKATHIFNLGSVGSICGNITLGLLSDLLMCRSPMEFTGCIIGTIFLGLLTSLKDN
mmetsp:Transcript_36554/g.49561  ORF Transcript_36554/g.49561 Transcript_36554/m.49561 type:complete len:101 (+) Transcript_36554:1075-1377(+)